MKQDIGAANCIVHFCPMPCETCELRILREENALLLSEVEELRTKLTRAQGFCSEENQENARLWEALKIAIEMMQECAADEHCGGESLLDNIAKAREALEKKS